MCLKIGNAVDALRAGILEHHTFETFEKRVKRGQYAVSRAQIEHCCSRVCFPFVFDAKHAVSCSAFYHEMSFSSVGMIGFHRV